MKEFLWIGRGGQGAFTAAKLFGAAYALCGDKHDALAFPSFGPERRGAPVRAFTKLDSKPILDRSETAYADYIIVLDETLYHENLKEQRKPNGIVIVNSKSINGDRVISFDGTYFAKQKKLPTANTVMLGVTAVVSGDVSIKSLMEAIDRYMPEKIREKNKQVMIEATKEVIR